MIVEIIFAIVLGFCVLRLYSRQRRIRNLMNKLPGPKYNCITGNLSDFRTNKLEDLIPLLEKYNKQYYPIYRTWGPFWAVTNILRPEDAEIILSHPWNIQKGMVYKFLSSWLKEGLLLSTGEKWRTRRKILTPAFHFNILTKYMEVLSKHGVHMVESLKGAENEKVVDLMSFMTYHTLNAICEAAMGVSLENVKNEAVEEYRKAVHFMGQVLFYRLFRPYLMWDFIFFNFTKMGRKQKRALKILHGFSAKIINERKEYHEKTGRRYLQELSTAGEVMIDENNDVHDGSESWKMKKQKLAMLDLLIVASNDGLIDDAGIQEEIDTFIFEGHDTSAMAIVYTLQLLAEHIEIQERARLEIDEMWKSCSGDPGIAEMSKLPYLERCMKESLRLYPAVPFISRKLTQDIQLSNYHIPAGTITSLHVFDMQRDPKIWPEPLKFDPDRFLSSNRHPFSWIPFSAGPRNCIGQRFAMLEMKTFTAYVLRNFYLEAIDLHENFRRAPDLTLRSFNPIRVKFIQRKI